MLSKVLKMLYVMAAHSCGKMISPCYGIFFLSVSLTYMTFPSHSAGQLLFYGTWKPKVNILVAVMATSLGFFLHFRGHVPQQELWLFNPL